MTNIRNALMQAAGTAASGDPVYVEDVFSVDLSVGTGSNITVNNGIDLSGEGGLVIWRRRDSAENWSTQDTERGVNSVIYTDSSNAAADPGSYGLDSFNSNGFTAEANAMVNGGKFCSWTFRKQEGFFDVVKFSTTGGGGTQAISHSLGSIPGFILIKKTSAAQSWFAFHKSVTSPNSNWWRNFSDLTTAAFDDYFSDDSAINSAPTSTTVTVGSYFTDQTADFIMYVFAEGGSGDQIFGDDGDEAIIKTGTYQSDGNGNEVYVDLGFEPQWIMIKSSTDTQSWIIQDNMRGMAHSTSTNNYLLANSNGAENSEGTAGMVRAESNGMTIGVAGIINMFNSVQTYTYMAIRRGPMKEPTAGTDVYAGDKADTSVAPMLVSNFPVDLVFPWRRTDITNTNKVAARLLNNNMLNSDSTGAAYADSDSDFDFQNGYYSWAANNTIYWGNMFRRYPKVFDVVVYTGNGSARTINHNLGVTPEMIIKKRTDSSSFGDWIVWVNAGLADADFIKLNSSNMFAYGEVIDSSENTASVFGLTDAADGNLNYSKNIAFLFASLDGISKVGTYSGTGNDVNVTGLGAAARFVLIKRTDSSGDWYIFDTTQGIASGNDPYVLMNSTSAQVTNTDYIDPHSSGFTVTSSAPAALNASGGTYIYLAFA